MVDNADGFNALAQKLGELQFHFGVNVSSQLPNEWALISLNLLRQKLQRLLVVERTSRQQQELWEDKLRENK